MKKIIIEVLSIILALNVCSIKPVFAEENQNNEPVISEIENAEEVVEFVEENEDKQENEENISHEEDEIFHEEVEDLQEENITQEDFSNGKVTPSYSLNTVSGPLTSGSVLHTGNCGANGDNLTYTIYSDKSLVISGTGDMADYFFNDPAPWAEYAQGWKPVYQIIIEEGVTSIGDYAFCDILNVDEPIVLPSTLEEIGDYAFDGDYLLSKVYIPSTVEIIGVDAFRKCSSTLVLYTNVENSSSVPAGWDSSWDKHVYYINLNSNNITYPYYDASGEPNLEKHVEPYTVSYNTSLETFNSLTSTWDYNSTTKILTISGNGPMTTYLWDAQPWFSVKNKIDKIVIEEGVTTISPSAFMMNTASSVTIPSSVFHIGKDAFVLCNLTSVTIPATVTKIGTNPFGSDKTISMTVESGNPVYDSRDNCNAIIETNTNTLISGCKNTVIPSTVTTIAENAFQEIESITYFDFPSTVEHIYQNFDGCFGLNKIFVSKETDTIDKHAFDFDSSNLVIYTDVEDSNSIPAGWDEDWNGYGFEGQKIAVEYGTSHDEFVDIVNRQPVPNDITIKEDTSGNIVIHTSDAAYLQALVTKQSSESTLLSYFSVFFNDNSSSWWFYNSTGNYGDHIELEYNATKGNVTLASSIIKSRNIVNGSTLVRINVEGYEYCEKIITLSRACKPAPTDVTISENTNGDIVITSSNTAWIKLLAQNGSVLICDDPEFDNEGIRAFLYGFYAAPEGSFKITNSGKTLTITNEHIINAGIPSGTYYIQISTDGYGVYEYSNSYEITKGAKIVDPSTISIECDQVNGTIKIKSSSDENNEYMEKLASYFVENYITSKEEAEFECEGGQIRISDNDSVFAWFENYKHKTNGILDSEFTDMELSDDKRTLTLTKDAIYKYHVIKNRDYEIYFRVPGYIDVNKEISNLPVGVEVCPTVEIVENGQGDIVISSNDLDYLRALVEENSDGIYDRGYIYLRTHLQNIPVDQIDIFGNASDETVLILNEDAKTVTINNNDLLENNVINGSHDIELYAYGYSVNNTNVTLQHACELAPTGVTATVNTSGDLVITSTNTDWIDQLATYGEINFASTKNEDMYLVEANPENSFIVTNGGKTVTIRRNYLLESNIANGTYSLILSAPGYSRVSITKTITLTKAYKPISADVVNVTYDNVNKAIVISSTNKDYLTNLCKVNKYYSYTNATYSSEEGGYISFYNENNDGACFENNLEYFDGKLLYKRNDYSLSANKLSVIIPLESLYNQALVEGYAYDITLHAAGYQTICFAVPDTLTFGVSEQLPEPIGISFDTDGEMYISAQDSDWLEGIMYDQTGAGRIELYDEDGTCVGNFSNYYYEEPVIERVDNAKIKLAKEAIWLDYVVTGDYYIRIYSHGYKTFETNQTQEIKGLRQSPSPITAKLIDDKVILEYGDNDKTYLNDLAATDSAPIVGGAKSYVAFVQESDEDNGLYYTNQNGDNSIFYDETNKYAYVELSNDGKNYLKKHFNNVDDLKIELYAFGYKDYTIDDFEFKFIDEPGPIVLGGVKQLTFSDYDESKVTWESSDAEIAEINNDGVLTAKGVGSVTITATYKENSVVVSSDNITVTVTSNSRVALKLKTTDGNATGIIGTNEQLELTATGYTLTDKDSIVYTSSDETVATISNGTVSFKKPGIVTITATAVGGRTATLKLTVYKVDPAKKVTLTYSGGTLETGAVVSDALEMLAGGEDLPNETELTYTSSNVKVVTVDANGVITAVGKGSATVTVALKDDPAKRKATCKVTVIDRVISSISDDLTVYDNSALVLNKCKEPENNNGVRYIHASYGLLNKNNKLRIDVTDMGVGEDTSINPVNVTPAKVTYKSSNTSIATVDANGNITFKKAGKVTITVTVASNPKGHDVVSRDIEIETVDYTPRIEVNKFVLNKYYDYNTNGYPTYNLHKILSTESDLITNYKITDLNGNESEYFEIEYFGVTGNVDTFSINFASAQKDIPAKTYTQLLQFCVGDDNWYSYKVTIQVTATLPTVTPKVTGFYNTFTGENTLKLETTVKNGELVDDCGIEFVDSWVEEYDPETKEIGSFTSVSGKVRYRFDGYVNSDEYGYVEKTIKIPTKSTKPTVKLDNATVTLYIPNDFTGSYKQATVKLIDGNKNLITSGVIEQITALNNSDVAFDESDGSIVLTIPTDGLKAGKIVLSYTGDGWNEGCSVPLTINVKIATALPKAKLSATTITLDKNFANSTDVFVTIPGSSEVLKLVDFDNDTKGSDDITVENDNIDKEKISISSSVVGTYKVFCRPFIQLETETELVSLPLTVKVIDTKPIVKLKTSSVKFNRTFSESILIDFSLTNNKYNAYVTDFDVDNYAGTGGFTGDLPISVDLTNDGKLQLSYDKDTGSSYFDGKYKIVVTPKFKNENFDTLDNPINGSPIILSVELYSKAPTAAVTVKNAINPLDASSSSPVTVKLTNLVDDVESIEITDPSYSSLFEFDNLTLKVKDGADLSGIKDGTYKVNVKVKTSLISEGITTTLSIKVARKAPTVKLSASTINVYDTTLSTNTALGEIALDFDDTNYTIDDVIITPINPAYTVTFDSSNNKFVVKMADGSQIKSGSSVAFSAKLIWENDFTNNGKYTKTTTVKFNVKDSSYAIKATGN